LKQSLSIILPVHNEVGSLEQVLSEWHSSMASIDSLDHVFIICEDGSTDGTKDLIAALVHKFPIVNNSVESRRGYGQAVRDGIALAKTDFILCIDSDGQIGPERVADVWEVRSQDRFFIGRRLPRQDPFFRRVYSGLFRNYHWLMFPNNLHDPSCPFVFGSSKLFKETSPLLVFVKEGFWWGFVGACVKLNIPIEEIAIHHRRRVAGTTQVYKLNKMPGIIMRNCFGLLKLRLATVDKQR
jgi:glycosyltransferase involved in cell wall biosynthesis